jgi:hypothetical protein
MPKFTILWLKELIMDDALTKAKQKREKLLADIALVDQYINLHEQLFGGGVSGTNHNAPIQAMVLDKDAVTIKRRNNPAKIAEVARNVIVAAGHPVQRGDLVRRIEESGLTIHSDDKGKYIGTVMWRNDDIFVNIEGHGYWVKSEPLGIQGAQGLPLE